jgi:hypothetical protein
MVDGLVSGGKMDRRVLARRIAVVVLIVAVIVVAIGVLRYLFPPRDVSYLQRVYPGQTYLAWGGNPLPSGYVFRAIYFRMYANGSVIYASGTSRTSWTCPAYVYGQEGNSSYRVDYADAWTDGYVG